MPLAAGVTWKKSPLTLPFGFSSTTQFDPVGTFDTVTEPAVEGALIVMSNGLPGTGAPPQVRSKRKVPAP